MSLRSFLGLFVKHLSRIIEDDDYMDVREAVSDVLARWRYLAGALGVKPGQTSTIEASNRGAVERCMEESLLVWLRRAHNEKKRGPPSWRALVKAIAASAGGNNPASAMKLAAAHPSQLLTRSFI